MVLYCGTVKTNVTVLLMLSVITMLLSNLCEISEYSKQIFDSSWFLTQYWLDIAIEKYIAQAIVGKLRHVKKS